MYGCVSVRVCVWMCKCEGACMCACVSVRVCVWMCKCEGVCVDV